MTAPLLPLRDRSATRAPAARNGQAGAASPAPNSQHSLDAQHQAFDFQTAERAEILREGEALETLLMEHLKNEDEIMKKWIAMI